MSRQLKLRFCIIFCFTSIVLPNLFGQNYDYNDKQIDLWKNKKQTPQEGYDGYYVPKQDYPGSVPYISQEELDRLRRSKLKLSPTTPEELPKEVYADATTQIQRRIIDKNYISAYYLANVTYGIATGALMGAWASVLQNSSARQNISNVGIGAVVGGLLGYYIGSLFEPSLIKSGRGTILLAPEIIIKPNSRLIKPQPNNINKPQSNNLEIRSDVFSMNF